MKKIGIIICIVFTFIGCSEDFLNRSSLTQIAEANFWQSESDAFLALNAVYSTLQVKPLYGGNLNGFQGYPGFDGMGDNAFTQFKYEGPAQFMEGTMDPTHGMVFSNWDNLYQGIARVNAVIKNANEISTDLVSTETKDAILGQAYFLRALFYFNIAVFYEEAPLITEPQTLQNAFVPKNTYDEITAQIREDLIAAVAGLPNPADQPENLYGYATKGAALGLFARVQLYNKVYNGPNGVLELTQQAMSLGYSLDPNYSQLFSEAGENSPEIVFSVRFLASASTSSGENFTGTFFGTPKVDQRPMPNLVDDFYCIDGLPISSSPLYDNANKGANRDPRANATIYFNGDTYLTDPTVRVFPGNGPTGFGMRKYIRTAPHLDGNAVFAEGSQDFYVIRYADILLMRAEAMAETGDIPGATALVNQIRARVGMPSVEQVEGNGTTLTQNQMIQIVRHERRVEFALEGLRFMDLKRWGTIEEAFLRAQSDPVGSYNPQYLQRRSEVFPIPQNEIDVNPQLIQNPAWQ